MNDDKRPNGRVVSVRLLPEESEVLTAKAKEANMSRAQFLKNVIRYGGAYEKTNFTRGDIRNLTYEINRIGSNLSQIYCSVHSSEEIDEIEFLKLRDHYLDLLSAFYYFIHGKDGKKHR